MSIDAACDALTGQGERAVSVRRDVYAVRIAERFAETIVVAALFVELALVLGNVLARGFFQHANFARYDGRSIVGVRGLLDFCHERRPYAPERGWSHAR